ncbi:mechanosensitive ion channel domain-containing protein [Methylotetracoccus oryzae]|uniref:mechanosensitive ion channel domain-containing protein n=1 Tax=Methylotetracoccus oryzae TaxID=1919059 RepID=UPI001117E42E|nr:mechanosensitive ion channel domain-containing protein [Methylotetracoccus oryzae]
MTPPLQSWVDGLMAGLDAPLFDLGTQPVSLSWLLETALLLCLVALVTHGAKRLLKNRLLRRFGIGEANREVIAALVGFVVAVTGTVLVLQAKGLNLANLAMLAGGLGIGVGLGLQELTKNLASGATLLGERKLKVGDLIEFDGKTGLIQEISIRATVIRTFRGSELIVPNSELTNHSVENWSYSSRRGRIDIPVQVEFGTDPVLVTELLLQSAFAEEAVLREPAPKVIFRQFGEYGLEFLLWVWVDRIDRSLSIHSSLNFIIEYHFRLHGVRVPQRQSDGWVGIPDTPVRESNEALPVPPRTLRARLLSLPYFRNFDELQIRGLIEMGQRRELEADQILVNQGEREHAFCIVLCGAIDAFYENRKISRRVFTFREGEFFGELPLLLNMPYPTTLRAVERTSLFVIPPESFLYLLERYPRLKQVVLDEMDKRREQVQLCRESLRALGVLDDDRVANPVTWLRERLTRFFGTQD